MAGAEADGIYLPRQNLATGENDGHKNRELAK
jgi:hypothetical protein